MREPLLKVLLIPALALAATGADSDYSRWDAVPKQYVTTASRVDYQSLNERGLTGLDGHLEELAEPRPAGLDESDPDGNTARVSAIFEWYAEDVDQAGGVRDFLARFAPETHGVFLSSPEVRIEHLRYNWGVNDTPVGGSFLQLSSYWDWAGIGNLGGDIKDWFLNLGREHGVNPIIFGGIYVGAIPLFSLSVAWLIQNLRRRRSPLIPALCASFCFVSAYLYLLIAGQNIPAWVYFFVAGLLGFGVHSTVRKIKSKLNEGTRP